MPQPWELATKAGPSGAPAPAPAGDPWSLATPLGGTPVPPARQSGITAAVVAGIQNSATGLALRGRMPDQVLSADAPWYERALSGAAGVVTDLPLSIVGAVGGATAGSAVAPVAGTVVGGGAGAFGAPMALREALIEAYTNNHALSWSGVWEIAKAGLWGGTKGALIGGATGGAGMAVGRVAGAVLAPSVGTQITARAAIAGTEAAALGAELATLTTTAAALEGHMPTWQEFFDNAVLLGGMKAATGIAGRMMNVYTETGRKPHEVRADAEANPALKAELLTGKREPAPNEAIHAAAERIKEKHGLAELAMWEQEGHIYVANIEAAKTGLGKGSAAMLDIINFADRHGMETRLIPEVKEGKTTSLERLNEFYERFGFEKTGKGNEMRREPRPVTIPDAYTALALEERIKAAIDADMRPDMVRKIISGEKDWVPLGQKPIADPVKYEYITDSDSAKGVLRSVADMYQREIETQRRGEVSNKATAMEALKMVANGELSRRVAGEAVTPAEVYARAHMLRGATEHAVSEMKKIAQVPESQQTPAMKLSALAAMERVALLQAEWAGARAEVGRAMQVMSAINRDPRYMQEAQTLIRLAEKSAQKNEGVGVLQDIARLVSALKDPAQVTRFAENMQKATKLEKVLEFWKAAILSGPQTHLANIMGNTIKWGVEIPESALAATFTAMGRMAKGDPLTLAQWKARAFAPLYGVQLGAKDAMMIATEVWKGKGEHLEKADVYRHAIEGRAGEIIRTPFRALQWADAFFRTFGERAEAHKLAVDRAVKEGLHPDTREFAERVALYTDKPGIGLSEKSMNDITTQIQQAGAEAVFAQRLGPLLETIQGAIARHAPAIGFVIPFLRTPANLVSWAIQHVPGLNLLSGRWRSDWAAGGERRAQAAARVVIGGAIGMTAATLVMEGLITGGGLTEKEEGGTKRGAGWQPYSFKIGDKYYSYQRMEPVAKVIGLAADMVEIMNSKKLSEADAGKMTAMFVLLFGNATISTTYLSGLSNVVQGLTDPERRGEQLLEQYASSIVPRIIGQTAAMVDDQQREVDGIIDAIESQIPFLRETMLPKRDVWGEPVKGDKLFEVLPIATSKEAHDKVKSEAMRLHVAISDAPRFFEVKGPFKSSEKREELTPEQRDLYKAVSGKTAMEWLSPIVNHPDWNRIPDFAQAAIIRNTIEKSRKIGMLAAAPPDDARRMKLQQEIIDRIIKEQDAAQSR